MSPAVILATLLLVISTGHAATPAREDFAAGYSLQAQGEGAILKLPLPEKVYKTVVHADLADIRVFDGGGNLVPHLLRLERPAPQRIIRALDLPFSPLYGVEADPLRRIDTRIVRGPEGAGKGGSSLDISSTIRAVREKTEQLNGYLLETAAIEAVPFRLHFSAAGDSDFMTTLTLEDSDDLTSWSLLGRETLAHLSYHGRIIEKNGEVAITRKRKYIRVRWPATEQKISLDQIQAITYSGAEAPVRNWTRLDGDEAENQDAPGLLILEFNGKGSFPVDAVRVGFRNGNQLIQATLKSRPHQQAPWRQQGQGIFYQLQSRGITLQSDALSLPMTSDRYWRLEIRTEGKEMLAERQPHLELGWLPHTLYFLNQGGEPHLLAYGSGRLDPASQDARNELDSLLKQTEQQPGLIQPARVTGEVILGGSDRLTPLPPPPPWKKWILWAVLLGGVLAIVGMAMSLYRQMRQGPG